MNIEKEVTRKMLIALAIVFILITMNCTSEKVSADDRMFIVKHQTIRYVTAYNAGDERQTDDTPCISADNSNICERLERGEKVCAANFVPLGTHLYVDKVGVCTVTDRMNRRYKNRVDIAMPKGNYKEALTFGRQKLMVRILKEINASK